jgi:hypothetical protein
MRLNSLSDELLLLLIGEKQSRVKQESAIFKIVFGEKCGKKTVKKRRTSLTHCKTKNSKALTRISKQ